MLSRFAGSSHARHGALLLAACVTACDRAVPRSAAGDTVAVASAPADTVVRRVIRLYREASAIQRVTQIVRPLRALAPLDTELVIRVLDQRGMELGGVPVIWTFMDSGAGAGLRVIDARTDTLGLSRAAVIPGARAGGQRVLAEVARVGRIEFALDVPVASIRVESERDTVWSGDVLRVRAHLLDDAGVPLHGGAVSWGSTDSMVLRVSASEPVVASARAGPAGSADVVAWIGAGTVRGRARVVVRPVVSGRLMTLAGDAVSARVDVIAGRARDSIAAESGRFAAHLALPPGGVDLRITPDTSVLHAALVRAPMGREVQDVTIALIPKTWRIDAGTHAGREIALDATQALRRASGSAGGFWRVAPGVPGLLIGWRDADFPLRIAFDRRRGVQADDADSIAFWRAAEEMQRDLGSTFFQPATLVGDARPAGVVVVDFNDGLAEGHTFVTWSRDGTIYEGTLTFRRPASVRDAGVVTHELLHLLGFGHGTGWPTISRATRDARVRLTPEDVAYVQVALRLRTLGQRHRARPGLPAPPN